MVAELAGIELFKLEVETSLLDCLCVDRLEPQIGHFSELISTLVPHISHCFNRDCKYRQPSHPAPPSNIGIIKIININPPAISTRNLAAVVGNKNIIIRATQIKEEGLFISPLLRNLLGTILVYAFLIV